MSNGEGPQGHLYPAFPYDSYADERPGDRRPLRRAAWRCRRTTRHRSRTMSDFPFNIRLAMAGWKHLFFKPQRFVARCDQIRAVEPRPLHRLRPRPLPVTCHNPRNLLGGFEAGRGAAPAIRRAAPAAKPRRCSSPISKSTSITRPSLVQRADRRLHPGFDVFGGAMGEVIRDETSQWTEADRAAVAALSVRQRLAQPLVPPFGHLLPGGHPDTRPLPSPLAGEGRRGGAACAELSA